MASRITGPRRTVLTAILVAGISSGGVGGVARADNGIDTLTSSSA
ncbi:hypothetical protein [Streptomyces sp. PTD5-9]